MLFICLVLVGGIVSSQTLDSQFPKKITVIVSNPLNESREEILVSISSEQLAKKAKHFNPNAFVVLDNGKEIPSQYNKHDKYLKGIVFVLDKLAPSESRTILIRYHPSASIQRTYEKKTQAELSHKVGGQWKNREYIGGEFKNVDSMRVPAEHKDHSWFIRYEGPGWESDKVAYRFYLDQRNAVDVFGKKSPEPILHQVGQDGFDSYHAMQPWGMDVMKVGNSLGVGSIGAINNRQTTRVDKTDSVVCRVVENGNVYSSISTDYYGWKVGTANGHLKSHISIHAGTRLTRQEVLISGTIDSLCTGIVKDNSAKLFKETGGRDRWGYIATYGKQSLNNDELGLVIFFNASSHTGFREDKFSHLVGLKPTNGKVEYLFGGMWILEQNGIKNETQFVEYLNKLSKELAYPIVVKMKD